MTRAIRGPVLVAAVAAFSGEARGDGGNLEKPLAAPHGQFFAHPIVDFMHRGIVRYVCHRKEPYYD
jgi:hypothetical protein